MQLKAEAATTQRPRARVGCLGGESEPVREHSGRHGPGPATCGLSGILQLLPDELSWHLKLFLHVVLITPAGFQPPRYCKKFGLKLANRTILRLLVFFTQYRCVTDGRTDGHTDGWTDGRICSHYEFDIVLIIICGDLA